jgi:hypothetical protein
MAHQGSDKCEVDRFFFQKMHTHVHSIKNQMPFIGDKENKCLNKT